MARDAQNQTEVVAYSHVGLGLAAEVDYPVADVQLDRTASGDGKRRTQGFTTQAAGVYPGWDRFGRVARQAWVDGGYTQHGSTGGLPDRPSIVELTHGYDRSGNRLTRYDGRPGARMPNWEFEYEYDGLDRLAEARRGSWDGSTFTAAAGTQEWALDLLGNWATFRHDRNGDGDFNDSSEVEDRTHNAANEVASAAIQGLGGSPFSQRHDHAGNWTRSVRSGAQRRDYVHDAWNRLVKATDDTQPATVRGEYEYNGLHWRTVKRLPGSSTTAERRLFYSASWQVLEERIDDDVDEGFEADRVAQQVWGVRYIDDAVLRRTDANADGDYVDEGDRVDYYLTDAQFSVVAVVGPTGALRERVAYSPYGEGRHHWPADLDGDGDVDSGDMAWYQNSANLVGIGHANYNPDADLNRDGVVNSQDIILALNWNGKAALASGLISDPNGPDSPVGYCGYLLNAETGLYTVRFRHYDPVWGRWVERDPAEFANGMHLLAYVENSPSSRSDSTGKDWRVNPVPAPIVPRPVPPTHEREREENGIVYLTRGKWNSKWIVNAWVKRDWQNPDCCELSISGNLIDRWYWADSADAQQEELWELKREEHYWDDLMQGLAAWKWATQGFVIPCDMAELAATLIQTGSNWNSDQATVDINREDMRNHPNPGYERSLEDAKRRARDAKNAFNATKRQLKNVMNEYKSGKANPCDCKPSAGAG